MSHSVYWKNSQSIVIVNGGSLESYPKMEELPDIIGLLFVEHWFKWELHYIAIM